MIGRVKDSYHQRKMPRNFLPTDIALLSGTIITSQNNTIDLVFLKQAVEYYLLLIREEYQSMRLLTACFTIRQSVDPSINRGDQWSVRQRCPFFDQSSQLIVLHITRHSIKAIFERRILGQTITTNNLKVSREFY